MVDIMTPEVDADINFHIDVKKICTVHVYLEIVIALRTNAICCSGGTGGEFKLG